jgi:glutamine synthetase
VSKNSIPVTKSPGTILQSYQYRGQDHDRHGQQTHSPGGIQIRGDVAGSVSTIKTAVPGADTYAQEEVVKEVSSNLRSFKESLVALEKVVAGASEHEGYEAGVYYRDVVFTAMTTLRMYGEAGNSGRCGTLPLPTYAEMLFLI